MNSETVNSQNSRIEETKAAYDSACKRVLSEKIILAWIMKSCMEEYQNCSVDEIAEKYIEGQPQIGEAVVMPDEDSTLIQGADTEDKSPTEGTVLFDICFNAIVPGSGEVICLIINIEVQLDFYPGYPLPKRAIYYCSRMISSQYGKVFTHSHYEKIKKVYSVWICIDPPKRRRNTITSYQMAEKNIVGAVHEKVQNYDLLTVIMICLGGPEADRYEGLLRLLDILFTDEKGVQEKRKILQEDYDIKMTHTFESEVSEVCNLSQGIWEKGRTKGIEEGIVQGREEGIVQGREEGIVQGREEGEASSLYNLMRNMNLTIEQAMAALGIPTDEQQKYIRLLEQ